MDRSLRTKDVCNCIKSFLALCHFLDHQGAEKGNNVKKVIELRSPDLLTFTKILENVHRLNFICGSNNMIPTVYEFIDDFR